MGLGGEHSRQLEDTKSKLREAQAKLDQQRYTIESHKATIDERLSYIEAMMTDAGSQKMMALAQDLEKRIQHVQGDQKMAREVLESSIAEQLRLEHTLYEDKAKQIKEHWDRELK